MGLPEGCTPAIVPPPATPRHPPTCTLRCPTVPRPTLACTRVTALWHFLAACPLGRNIMVVSCGHSVRKLSHAREQGTAGGVPGCHPPNDTKCCLLSQELERSAVPNRPNQAMPPRTLSGALLFDLGSSAVTITDTTFKGNSVRAVPARVLTPPPSPTPPGGAPQLPCQHPDTQQ